MSVRIIEKNLIKALIQNGKMAQALYEWEIEEHLDYYQKSLKKDNDNLLLVVTEHTDHVAMLLIERSGEIHINEAARDRLKVLWKDDVYLYNMKILIPEFAQTLSEGNLAVIGQHTFATQRHLLN